MPNIVYRYRLHTPHEGWEAIRSQFEKTHIYRKNLVVIERARRAAVREAELAVGDLREAKAKLDATVAAREAAYQAIAQKRKASRNRSESKEDRAAYRAACESNKLAREAWRDLRNRIKVSPELVAKRDAIGELAKQLANNCYKHSGVYWGQRALADEAQSDSFSDTPMYDEAGESQDPKFPSFLDDKLLGIQVMGGIDASKLHDCTDSRVRLKPPDERAWLGRGHRSDRRKYGSTAEFRLRIGTDDAGEPIWAAWICDMPRPLPKGARVVWATVSAHRVGPWTRWHLQLTLDVPRVGTADTPSIGKEVAVDVGWRVIAGADGSQELRIAGWQDSLGNKGELRLSAADLKLLKQPDEIRSERAHRYAMTLLLVQGLVKKHASLPSWLKEATATIHLWKSESFSRLAALTRLWLTKREETATDGTLAATIRDLQSWYYRDYHNWECESRSREQGLLRRREIYRIFAAQLADRYATIVIEKFARSKLARRRLLKVENETARTNRVLASTYSLSQAIIGAAASRQRELVELPTENTTRECPSCGRITDRKAAQMIVLACECGAMWDQDIEGAPLVLLKRLEAHRLENQCEGEGDEQKAGAAREGEKEKENGTLKESRWARVKRLREEKVARMEAAREEGGKVAKG